MSGAVIFAGPSIWGIDLTPFAQLTIRPPARQGDIALAARQGFEIIGLIDGVFENELAVWHKEILWAMEQGAVIAGGSSMGALRAAECAPFGMVGIGSIFLDYAEGRRVADADVAVVHAPSAFKHQPLSLALVNVEATLNAARSCGAISSVQEDRLEAVSKGMHFKERTWESVVAAAGFEPEERALVERALKVHEVDLKRANAVEVLKWTRQHLQAPRRSAMPPTAVSKTPFLAKMLADVKRRELPPAIAKPIQLVPDCGGLIETIAIAVPPQCLTADEDTAPGRTLSALGNLARTMPTDVDLIVVTEEEAGDGVARWGDRLGLRCTSRVLATAPRGAMRGSDIWIQDAFIAGHRRGKPIHLRPYSEKGGGHAEWMTTVAPQEATGLFLPGGDVLVGKDFRLVGAYSVEQSAKLHDRSEVRAAIEAIDDRRVHYFGYRKNKEGPDATTLHPWGFHLDLQMSVTGLTENGRPVVLVAEPKAVGSEATSEPLPGSSELDAIASHFEEIGFRVMRNPVPRWPDILHGRISTRLYNNVLVENAVRPGNERPCAWLPLYGAAQLELAPFDEANAEIWSDLGFEVVWVSGWEWLAGSSGAIRCASKVLRRAIGV